MNKKDYDEMVQTLDKLITETKLDQKKIFLFGYCNATLELIDLLESKGYKISGILDNSDMKQGEEYKGVQVYYPEQELGSYGKSSKEDSMVLIVSRFYESMLNQLRDIGYTGSVRKLIDYNTYADYSLSDLTIRHMNEREQHGEQLLRNLRNKYPGYFNTFCPFEALGDIYFMISYWPAFATKREIDQVVFCVTSNTIKDVICMFGDFDVEVYDQKELDAMIQASLYRQDKNTFIAHHDRPYVINISKALYIKKIPLEQIYCCGVYGLPKDTKPIRPIANNKIYSGNSEIPRGKAVIFSPYAKSITAINPDVWKSAVDYYLKHGYKCFTNVIGDEVPLEGTKGISPSLLEMKSVVEQAGIFIGIRSGLCDIIREAKAKKVALYPDYNYCDTKWKAIEMYYINQFDHNILGTGDIEWGKI